MCLEQRTGRVIASTKDTIEEMQSILVTMGSAVINSKNRNNSGVLARSKR